MILPETLLPPSFNGASHVKSTNRFLMDKSFKIIILFKKFLNITYPTFLTFGTPGASGFTISNNKSSILREVF